VALAAALALPLAAVPAQDPEPLVEPAIQAQLTELLEHENPELRGEAALAAATTSRDPSLYATILEIAQDEEATARHRAIVAVGLLASPGAEVFLGDLLTRSRAGSVERLLAALALGMLPEETTAPARDEFLHRMQGGNMKRNRDALVSLLLGLSTSPHPSKMEALRELVDEAAIKDPVVRRLLIQVLALVPSPENTTLLVKMLEAPTAEVVTAALEGLLDRRYRLDDETLKRIDKLARRAGNPDVRAAALDILVSRRQLAALDLAPKAISSKHVSMIGAGMRAALRLGGGGVRRELDNSTLLRRNPLQQARMLEVSRGPHAREFLLRISEIAKGNDAPMELRVQAAAVVAAAGWKSIVPALSNLFLLAEKPRHLATLAECLRDLDVDLTAKIYPAKGVEGVHRLPRRLRALIAAGNTQAVAAVCKALRNKDLPAETKVEMLRAYRLAHQPWSDAQLKLAPEAIQALFH
jgi:HEAT repeat protein